MNIQTKTETGILPEYQLYNLEKDVSQQRNLASKKQKLIVQLENRMNAIRNKAKSCN
jgi:hypothetical protein